MKRRRLPRWNMIIGIIVLLTVINLVVLLNTTLKELAILEASEACQASAEISQDDKVNRRKIAAYPVGDSGPYLPELGLVEYQTNATFLDNPAVVVTAISSGYFHYAVGLVERLDSTMNPKLKIVVYDIGMTEEQRQKLCREGECELRIFPFNQYPLFLEENLHSMAWKPIVIQLALQEFGFIIWMDSAVYLVDGDLQGGIDISKQHGVAAGYKRVFYPRNNLAFETDRQTFKALDEKPCAFIHCFKFNAGLIFIRKSAYTFKYIMRPWVSCALTKTCIVAERSPYSKCDGANQYGFCHMFDQSVLSIILNRLFHSRPNEIDLGNKVKWTKCFKKDTVMFFNEMVFYTKDSDVSLCSEVYWKK